MRRILLSPIIFCGLTLCLILLATGLYVRGDASAQAAKVITIQDAIQNGSVQAWAEPIGIGFRQPMMRLHVKSLGEEEFVIRVPLGSQLTAPKQGFADLVTMDSVECMPDPQVEVDLNTFSLDFDLSFPSATGTYTYTVGVIGNEALLQMLEKVKAQPPENLYSAQLAVWSVSTGLPLEEVVGGIKMQVKPQDLEDARRLLNPVVEQEVEPPSPSEETFLPETEEAELISPEIETEELDTAQTEVVNTPAPSKTSSSFGMVICIGVVILVIIGIVVAGVLTLPDLLRRSPPPSSPAAPASSQPQPPATGSSRPAQSVPNKESAHPAPVKPVPLVLPVKPMPTDVTPLPPDQAPGIHILLTGVGGPLADVKHEVQLPCILSRGDVEWLVLDAPSLSIPHALFDLCEEPFRVKDLHSKNGTRLGDRRLETKPVNLAPGQEVLIGPIGLFASSGKIQVSRGPSTGKKFTVPASLVVLSREKIPVTILGEADGSISDAHAYLYLQDEEVWIRDLNSTNGTYVNQLRIQADTPIKSGDRLRLSKSEFEVQFIVD